MFMKYTIGEKLAQKGNYTEVKRELRELLGVDYKRINQIVNAPILSNINLTEVQIILTSNFFGCEPGDLFTPQYKSTFQKSTLEAAKEAA